MACALRVGPGMMVAALLLCMCAVAVEPMYNVINSSDFPVTISQNATDPRQGTVVQPQSKLSVSPGTYFFTNELTVEASLEGLYMNVSIENAQGDAGFVQLFVNLGRTLPTPIPISGDF